MQPNEARADVAHPETQHDMPRVVPNSHCSPDSCFVDE